MATILSKVGAFFAGLSWKVWAGAAVLALLTGTAWYCSSQVEERVEQAEETGRVQERSEQLSETIRNVEVANEAREEISIPGPVGARARYDQCLRTARDNSVCERWLPKLQED